MHGQGDLVDGRMGVAASGQAWCKTDVPLTQDLCVQQGLKTLRHARDGTNNSIGLDGQDNVRFCSLLIRKWSHGAASTWTQTVLAQRKVVASAEVVHQSQPGS